MKCSIRTAIAALALLLISATGSAIGATVQSIAAMRCVDARSLLKLCRRLVAFVGLIVPLTFTMAVLAAPPARQDAPYLPGCDRNLAYASASVAAMQARIKSLSGVDRSEICTATRLYFLEVVKARAVTALCKSVTERERDLGHFDADVADANEAIAARCL